MSEEVKATLFRDNRTQETCTLEVEEVKTAKGDSVKVLYAVYARGHRRALEAGEEKNFTDITPVEEAVAPQTEA